MKQKFPGYEDRPEQREMAEEILRCLVDGKNLLIEAGTGVGKSFAYLIPAILSEEKTIVSTSSLALQDQLVTKDLVFLREALPRNFSFDILKGRNNYICLRKEKEYAGTGKTYGRFRKWLAKTATGEKSELTFIPRFWPEVCGDSQDCGGRKCPSYGRCFYYDHYRQLNKADILVVNHHLLFYDLLSDFNILPFHDRLIIDEASDIEDVISGVFGSTLSYARTTWLLYRLRGVKIVIDHLFPEVEYFFKKVEVPVQSISPIPAHVIERLRRFKETLALGKTLSTLEKHREGEEDDETRNRIEMAMGFVRSYEADMDDFIARDDATRVYYITGNGNGLEFRSSLVESQNVFRLLVASYGGTVMTSATLTSGGNFSYIRQRLGIEGFEETIIGSPFDYRRKALLYVAQDLPRPDREGEAAFELESLGTIEELIDASRGRALVLFTSYRHLRYAAENITPSYPIKSQGDMPPGKLIRWFKDTPHSVLLATATFWQGVDIKGDDLSLVIITRLPFSSPGDPVYQERCNRLGGRWFHDLALPSAVLTLRQGFGRLIRGHSEYGVVAILDTRVVKSTYGKTILASLPEVPVTHTIKAVRLFFESIPETVDAKKIKRKPATGPRVRKKASRRVLTTP